MMLGRGTEEDNRLGVRHALSYASHPVVVTYTDDHATCNACL